MHGVKGIVLAKGYAPTLSVGAYPFYKRMGCPYRRLCSQFALCKDRDDNLMSLAVIFKCNRSVW